MVSTRLGSTAMRSASRPTSMAPFGTPRISAGRDAIAATTRLRSRSPARERRIRRGKDVATPGAPAGASAKAASFSSSVCGAWSLATASIRPLRNASHSASRSPGDRSGGFTFPRAPRVQEISRKRCSGEASQLAPAGNESRPSRVVTWATWILAFPRIRARRAKALVSASFGRASAWSARETTLRARNLAGSSAWTTTSLRFVSDSRRMLSRSAGRTCRSPVEGAM